MKTLNKIILLLSLILLYQNTQAFDINLLWPINSSVIDKTWILSLEEKTWIETKIEELRTKYTTEILLVIIWSTNWEEISSVATEIWQKIGVWKADKDNWVVILIALNDRAWNIATWYWVEWVLPDLLTKRIWEKNFILFRDSRYFDWIMWTLNDFDKAFVWDPSIISLKYEAEKQDDWTWIFVLFIAIFVSAILFRPVVKEKKYKKFIIYFVIAYLITLPFVYIFLWIASLIANLIMWAIWAILWITWKVQKWWYTSSWSSWWFRWWGGGWFWGFWWGGFGWGWSSWKW